MTDANNSTAITKGNEFDEIYKNLNQVRSMLLLVYGGGMTNFDECSAQVRDDYIWACSDGIKRAIALVDHLSGISRTEGGEIKS